MRHLYLLLAGVLVNSVGSGLTAFGLAVFAYTTYGTASAVAMVQLCAFAPVVLLAPVAGALADHFDRRLMMILGDGGSVLGLGVVMLALVAPSPRLGHILLGVSLSSCLASLTEPALRASVSDLVAARDHVRASGLLQAASSARYLLSPVLAGLLLPLVGLHVLLVVDAATCLVTAACSWSVMRTVGRRPASGWSGRADVVDHLLGGWRVLVAQSRLRTLVGLMTVMTLLLGTLQVLVKPILLPHAGTTATGRAETLAACGALVGGLLVTALARARPTTLVSLGTAITGAAMVVLSLRAWTWWVALAGLAVFAAAALCNAGAETLVRRSIGQEHQARVWGTISLVTQTGYLLAYLGAGTLTDRALEPLLAPHGTLAPTLGTLVGTGTGRGAALLVALAGLAALVLAVLCHLRRHALTPPAGTQPTRADSQDKTDRVDGADSRHGDGAPASPLTQPEVMQ